MTAHAQPAAVAVFQGANNIMGTVLFKNMNGDCQIKAHFTKLPHGKHGFHIHRPRHHPPSSSFPCWQAAFPQPCLRTTSFFRFFTPFKLRLSS